MSAPTRFKVIKSSPSLWRVTFDNPPINLIDPVMIVELHGLLTDIEQDEKLAVVVFDSADPDYFMAHYDTAADASKFVGAVKTTTAQNPWGDFLFRLSKTPVVTISAIRGRARGAGSEFALATDIRFASREKAVLGQFEVGFGVAPGGGPGTRLPGIVGRGRAFEILLGGEDFDGDLAERYGYVNRAIPDADFTDFVDAFAERVSRFDLAAIADIKTAVNAASLPTPEALIPEMDAYMRGVARKLSPALREQAFKQGFQERGAFELNLGAAVGTLQADPELYSTR
ncbi:enoyl-CoA hydratase/isomerase family protein [Streptomyces variegatus]|uniref:enoyl-CoA hydratase/isomerase family protein n=1 Tax=Streptomyces variegatus TaxID=284040 RepID=UPI003C2C6F04